MRPESSRRLDEVHVGIDQHVSARLLFGLRRFQGFEIRFGDFGRGQLGGGCCGLAQFLQALVHPHEFRLGATGAHLEPLDFRVIDVLLKRGRGSFQPFGLGGFDTSGEVAIEPRFERLLDPAAEFVRLERDRGVDFGLLQPAMGAQPFLDAIGARQHPFAARLTHALERG
jgi:hypothetical protein